MNFINFCVSLISIICWFFLSWLEYPHFCILVLASRPNSKTHHHRVPCLVQAWYVIVMMMGSATYKVNKSNLDSFLIPTGCSCSLPCTCGGVKSVCIGEYGQFVRSAKLSLYCLHCFLLENLQKSGKKY